MAISTAVEQTYTLYSATSDIQYWIEWAKEFIVFCKDVMGWEVVAGPGTSYGAIMPYYYHQYSGSDYWTSFAWKSAGWDSDWTRPNGIVQKWEESTDGSYPLCSGWFYEYPVWNLATYPYGLDEIHGRFDIVVYMDSSDNTGEKIGFRLKFPLGSIGYASNGISTLNFLYIVPGISVYSSKKGNIQYKYPLENSDSSTINKNTIDEATAHYINIFSKQEMSTNGNLYIGKTTIGTTSAENIQSPLFTYEFQDEDIKSSSIYGGGTYDNRVFPNYWKIFNKINYHISKDGYTTYFYVYSDINSQLGFEIISTTLENGEKAVIIGRRATNLDNTLFEHCGVTGTFDVPGIADGNYLIRAPFRPYRNMVSLTNRFAFSRMLIPFQSSLCKDLYYVSKRDITDSVGLGQYVMVYDKENIGHYFRVIPFGSSTKSEVIGDNTTLLAYPISDPEVDE